MKVAIYARVSSYLRDEKNQLPDIESLIQSRGFEVVASYHETASAWKNGHQVEFARLIKAAQAKEFDGIVVWSLDRLTREGPHKILAIYKKLEDLGITVISCKEPWTEAPSSVKPLLLAVFGWIAEQESRRQSERTKAGLLRKKLNGGRLGRPPGSKDRRKRKKKGYILRQARDRVKRAEELQNII